MKKIGRLIVSSLSYSFGADIAKTDVFVGFSADIPLRPGEVVTLQGSNGVGKSVLASLLAGLALEGSIEKGEVYFCDQAGQRLHSVNAIYVPQNFENGDNRLAIDLFASVGSAFRLLLDYFKFSKSLQRAGVRQLHETCDAIDRLNFLKGLLASVALSDTDLLIIDEPFAQLGVAERAELNSCLALFAVNIRIPLLIVAHPGQTPSASNRIYALESTEGGEKKIVPRALQFLTPSPITHPTGPLAFELRVRRAQHGTTRHTISRGIVNRQSVPSGIAPGRFAALIAGAIRARQPRMSLDWHVEALLGTSVRAWDRRSVRFLPIRAQTSVVLSNASLARSSLFDRWELGPRRRFPPSIDMRRLNSQWFGEASSYLPIQHERAETLGRRLSGGNRQMLALRTVAYPFPEVLVVTLPFAGLDELNTRRVEQFLQFAARSGVIVITIEVEGGGA